PSRPPLSPPRPYTTLFRAPSISARGRTSPYHARPPLRRGGCARADQGHQGNAGAVGEPVAAQRRGRSGLHDGDARVRGESLMSRAGDPGWGLEASLEVVA